MKKFTSLRQLRASYLENMAAIDKLSECAMDEEQRAILEDSRLEYERKLEAVENVMRNRDFLSSMSDVKLKIYNANSRLEKDPAFTNSPPEVRAKILMRSMADEMEYLNTRYPPAMWGRREPRPEPVARPYSVSRGMVAFLAPVEAAVISGAAAYRQS